MELLGLRCEKLSLKGVYSLELLRVYSVVDGRWHFEETWHFPTVRLDVLFALFFGPLIVLNVLFFLLHFSVKLVHCSLKLFDKVLGAFDGRLGFLDCLLCSRGASGGPPS